MTKTFALIALLLLTGTLHAQLFRQKMFYPQTSTVTRKSFSGSAGKGFWTLEHLDSLGRPVSKDYYRKKKLLQQDRYRYNDKNDIVEEIVVFDINNPARMDTVRYEYIYDKELIIYQKRISANQDSAVVKLEENKNDSLLRYTSRAYYRVQDKNAPAAIIRQYLARFSDHRITKLESESMDNRSGNELVSYQYDDKGRLIRRIVDGGTQGAVMLGSPGGDIREYEYRYDRQNRLSRLYSVDDGNRKLVATYTYR